ncbi:MAG: hemin receptor [Prevotella sp.]|nr:hemin receptor [Prevotella sp.]
MKKILSISLFSILAITLSAQETYENANLVGDDLNGTARYVGMGGAMDALGADISTIGTNPAGIGLFRHSTANVSFGFVSQQGTESYASGDKTNMSFDQVGFVYSHKSGSNSFVNFAFNYHKSKNFDFILSAADALNGASQNKLSYMKGKEGVFDLYNQGGTYVSSNNTFNQVDYLYYNMLLADDNENYSCFDANSYMFNRENAGYIGEYDFNISGNVNDRFYWGVTFGISDVHYKGYGEYIENLVDANNSSIGSVLLSDERRITGTGFNIKAGIIVRPIESSPFRIGLSVSTPTWYDLTTTNYTTLQLSNDFNANYGRYDSGSNAEAYDFSLFTPWKFGVSVGTTFGKYLAVGAVYEYDDYAKLNSRINDGYSYDWYYDAYYTNTSSDRQMNRHTRNTLKGVSTLKLGLELKPVENLSVRVGYNYVSPKYDKNGYKDGTINSPGSYYASQTDYTNWGATDRFTAGVGYNFSSFSVDLAYQFTKQQGDFYPFTSYYGSTSEDNNICSAVQVNNKRHQLLLTLGYHF